MQIPIPSLKLKRNLPILITILLIFGIIYLYSDLFYTLASFQQVNDTQIYLMTLHGDSQIPQTYDKLLATYPEQMPNFSTFAQNTTLISNNFLAKNPAGNPVIGFNLYDYHTGPTLFLINQPKHGYESVSLVNLAYIGVDDPAGLGFFERKQLLLASSIPLAGVNEKGLIITCSAGNSSEVPYKLDQQTLTGFTAIRLILDQAKNIEDAMQLLSSNNLRFTPWPHLHYLISDAQGQSVIVEFNDEEMVTTRSEDFQVMTNLYTNEKNDSHWQHVFLTQELSNKKGTITYKQALELLEVASEPEGLHWSAIINGATKEISLALDGNFSYFHKFVMDRE